MIYDDYDRIDLRAKIKEAERKMRRQERAALIADGEGETKTESINVRLTPTVADKLDLMRGIETKTNFITQLIEDEYLRRKIASAQAIQSPPTSAGNEHLGKDANEVER